MRNPSSLVEFRVQLRLIWLAEATAAWRPDGAVGEPVLVLPPLPPLLLPVSLPGWVGVSPAQALMRSAAKTSLSWRIEEEIGATPGARDGGQCRRRTRGCQSSGHPGIVITSTVATETAL